MKKFTVVIMLIFLNLSVFCQIAVELYYSGIEKSTMRDYAGAVADFSKAIQLNPKFAEAYFERGKTNIWGNGVSFQEGILDFNKAIELNPTFSEAYLERASAKFFSNDFMGSIQDFNKVIELVPNAEAYKGRALAKSSLQDFRGAIGDFSKAIELTPSDAFLFLWRGQNKGNLKDYNGAIEDFNEAIGLDPNNAEFYYERGIIKIELSKTVPDQKNSGCLDLSKAGELGYPQAYVAIRLECN